MILYIYTKNLLQCKKQRVCYTLHCRHSRHSSHGQRPWIGLFQDDKCYNVLEPGLYVREKRRRSLFPPNYCALLALDTGHLLNRVIHEDAQKYLNLQETSAGGIIQTCTAFGGTRSLFHFATERVSSYLSTLTHHISLRIRSPKFLAEWS